MKKLSAILNSPVRIIAAGVGVLLLLAATYVFFVHSVLSREYRIFNFENNVSWKEKDIGIYRRAAKADIDNLLLSRDAWRDFNLSFNLINPHRPGIIFHYQDGKNYGFVYFQEPSRSILIGRRVDGKAQVYAGITDVPFTAEQKCRLEVLPTQVRLLFNDFAIGFAQFPRAGGQMGFLIQDADTPTTLFNGVTISGHLQNGRTVFGRSPTKMANDRRQDFGAFLLLHGAVWLSLFYLFWVSTSGARLRIESAAPRRMRLELNSFTAGGILFLLAGIIFWPFFFQGKILASSYDNFGEIYPLFFFSKHQFADWLAGKGFPLWNSYFHNGTPFFSSHWNMIYSPLNWPIFFLPDSAVLAGITLKTFLEIFLMGFLVYKFLEVEIGRREWALFGALVYQLSSVTIFACSLFPTVDLLFGMAWFVYLLWSMPARRPVISYLLLTLAGYLVLTSANVAFVFYAGLALFVLTVYRLSSAAAEYREKRWIIVGSVITAGLLSCLRLVPCLLAIAESNRMVSNFSTIHDRGYLVTRLFLPEIAGWFGPDNFNALMSLDLNAIFRQMDLPSNPQNAFFVYFGVLPALLLLASFFLPLGDKAKFWRGYAVVTLAICLLLQPLWGMLMILFHPFNHFSYQVIILPLGIAALAGWCGRSIFEDGITGSKFLPRLFNGLLLAQIYILVFLTYLFPALTNFTRVLAALILLAACLVYFRASRRDKQNRWAGLIGYGLLGLFWVIFYSVLTWGILHPMQLKEAMLINFVLPLLGLLLVLTSVLWALIRAEAGSGREKVYGFWGIGAGAAAAVFFIFAAPFWAKLASVPLMYKTYWLDVILGQLRLALIAGAVMMIVLLFTQKRIGKIFAAGLLLIILAADLIGFQGRFNNIAAPFSHRDAFYEKGFEYVNPAAEMRARMDLQNYRVSALHKIELNANKNIIFEWPSYIGTLGYLSQRFSEFISSMGFPKEAILIYPEDDTLASERFLDLSAVRYVFLNTSSFRERPGSLSRLNIFYNYEIADDERALARLSDPAFDVQRTVLVPPNTVGVPPQPGRLSERVNVEQRSANELRAKVALPSAAVLLFAESYDPGWKAYVDGRPVPVFRANFNFMGLVVDAGGQELLLRYEPRRFVLALGLSLAGVAALAVCLIRLLRKRF